MIRTLKAGKITIEINLLILLVLLLVLFFGYIQKFLLILVSILLHEIGHMVVAAACSGKVFSIRILPVGMNAVIDDTCCTFKGRLLVYVSGPLVNTLLSILMKLIYPYFQSYSENINFFMLANISLAVFNMLPILPMDGGRLIREILYKHFGFFLTMRYLKKISLTLSVFIVITGIFQFLGGMHNFSLLVIGIYMIFFIKSGTGEAALMNVKYVVYRRARILRKGIYPARNIVVLGTMHLGEAIKAMDFDMFHIIHVLDKDLKLVGTVTEQEVINAAVEYSADISFQELLERDGGGIS